MTLTIGSTLDLATHPITRSHGVGGVGTITAITTTDPVNHKVRVIVRTRSCYLHIDTNESALTEQEVTG